MDVPYTPPEFEASGFNCPHCGAYAAQAWSVLRCINIHQNIDVTDVKASLCAHCGQFGLWEKGVLVWPRASGAPKANPDMPEDVREDYAEASAVLGVSSPRAAAALLRLALQKLMVHLGQDGERLNDDIAALVEQGLPSTIQQSLDAVRVVGNESVHPGQMDVRDDPDVAIALFGLINLIVRNRITEPREVRELYEKLPQSKRDAIDARDQREKPAAEEPT